LARLAARRGLAMHGPSGQHDRELLPHLAIAGVKYHVLGVGIDSHDPGDLTPDPRLLKGLPHSSLRDRLAKVDCAAGHRPVPVIRSPDQQNLTSIISHNTLTAGTRLLAC